MTFKEFIDGNKAANKHYFDKDTMRFFASRLVGPSWNGDGYFITSEQFKGVRSADGPHCPRLYSIRKGNLDTFDVDTVGVFQEFTTLAHAKTALRTLRELVPA